MYLRAIAYNYHLYRRMILTMIAMGAATLLLVLSLVLAPVAGAIDIGGPSDCDNNAVISCGAHSTGALISAYNSSAYVRAVYAYFGISQADMANLPANNVAGRVTKDGNVFVDGQSRAVATGAITGGRQNITGSTQVNFQGITFFKRPPSVSFQQSSLPAFVSMQNGRFQFAIIASCGNAVRAVPTAAPQQTAVAPARAVSQPQAPQAKPQPMTAPPAPTQTQTQSQSQEVNVNSTNINSNTQINKQESVPQTVATPTAQPQATTGTPAAQPATQTAAASLPNTGPTGTIGLFLAAVGLGTYGYRRFLVSRFGR